jgi:ABC-2 type transport system ATP-binding protein
VAVVEASELVRTYGAVQALRGVSFRIDKGEIVGLLGPNGAGKSTTMKILTTFLAPTSGSARVCGADVVSEPIEVRRRLGYLPESAPLYPEMRVADYLAFVADVRGLGPAERARAIERVATECDITDRLSQTIGTLSRGYRQRVGLAQALLHEPELLILDEPTNGLDPNQIAQIRDLVRRVGRTRTVILSTHILSEVEVTCDRVMIIAQGRLAADGPTAAIVGSATGRVLTIGLAASKVRASADVLAEQLGAIPGVVRVLLAAPQADALRFSVQATADVREAVFRWAVDGGHALVELSEASSNLEEVFRRLTVEAAP